MNRWKKLHDLAGVLVKDLGRYVPALWGNAHNHQYDDPWIDLRNRNEILERNPSGRGVHCRWTWSSELHACQVLPALGRRLMKRALEQWPIRLSDTPLSTTGAKVTFVFAHEGTERLPHLQHVIRTVFAQQGVQVECIVVDLSSRPIGSQLPPQVNYVHIDTRGISIGWRKSWAFNVGARRAQGEIVVFQDGDICIPERYALELLAAFREEFDAVSIQRFLFYLDEQATTCVFENGTIPETASPLRILQNFKGGTIAIRRSLFLEIGGFDEGFVGWGGEDDEFYNRCGSRRHCRFGYVPFVHLFHPPQPDRKKPDNLNINTVLPNRLRIPVEQRIVELRNREFGSIRRPDPMDGYKDQYTEVAGDAL